jgi:hypothetical protein
MLAGMETAPDGPSTCQDCARIARIRGEVQYLAEVLAEKELRLSVLLDTAGDAPPFAGELIRQVAAGRRHVAALERALGESVSAHGECRAELV